MSFPLPSVTEIILGVEMFSVIHALVWVAKNAEKFAVVDRDHIIRKHVHDGHKEKLTSCHEGKCASEFSAVLSTEVL